MSESGSCCPECGARDYKAIGTWIDIKLCATCAITKVQNPEHRQQNKDISQRTGYGSANGELYPKIRRVRRQRGSPIPILLPNE